MHPHCDHGIQFWSQNLEEISVEIEMVGRWAVKKLLKAKKNLFMNRDKKDTDYNRSANSCLL